MKNLSVLWTAGDLGGDGEKIAWLDDGIVLWPLAGYSLPRS
jgi:hypothetical protein